MAALNLYCRHYTFSSDSSLSFYMPHLPKPHVTIPPKPLQNPTKTSISTSFSLLTISIPNNPRYCSQSDSAVPNPDFEQGTIEKRLDEAREAVREYLEQAGASGEDASRISCNCPTYLNMLINGVDDLDEWNSWMTSATSSDQEIAGDGLEFRKKVYRMAEQKGDNGVLPFLESLGLSLSSATHLARYLSSSQSDALPLLIKKVQYVKEIFFYGSSDDELIGKSARRMMANLSISADEDVQQTLAFFEKIQARRGGLSFLSFENTSLRHLIESFPRLLFMPLQSRVLPILKFLEDAGVSKECIRTILLLFPPVLFYDIDKDVKTRLQSFQKIGVNEIDLGKMLVKYPWILSASVLDNFEKVLQFFYEEKVPRICSSHAIKKWPHILGCSINKMKIMVEQFNEMGITNKKLGQVIATSPQLLLHKPQEFLQVVSFFRDLGLDNVAISRTLGRCPEIFAASVDKTLEKKLQFLRKIGISKTHLPRVIRKYPELFVCDIDRALFPRIQYLRKSGLSKKDIRSMVSRFSPLLGYSIEQVLRPKLEFLVHTMGRPVSDVVDYPRYFSYSLEKKIKPRYWVLKGRNIEFTLQEMLSKNNEEFAVVYLGEEEMSAPLL